MGKKRSALFFFIIAAILSSFAYAQEYYADLSVIVKDDGLVEIEGITNAPEFFSGSYSEFTSKKGPYWLLNISSEKEFSDYIFEVTLPDGAEFNYFKASGRPRISYDDGIKIISSGTGELSIVVQYSIKEQKKQNLVFVWVASLFVAVTGLFFLVKLRKRSFLINKEKETSENIGDKTESAKGMDLAGSSGSPSKSRDYEKIKIVKKTLAESQEKIVDLLLDAGGELTQKQLQHRSGLPKATLSRNIDVLSRKGIIAKQSRGMTNMIMLNGDFDVK